ncbi:hypothetical protein Areg01_75620 [Actinoplanes regularis]|nr:hypothetical protein Areg01_75620 [Actinoplanes regularis]
MREHVSATVVLGDEAETLVTVEPFDGTGSHTLLPENRETPHRAEPRIVAELMDAKTPDGLEYPSGVDNESRSTKIKPATKLNVAQPERWSGQIRKSR